MLSKARIIKAPQATSAEPCERPAPVKELARILPRDIVDAHAAAAEIRRAAQANAEKQLSGINAEKERALALAKEDGYAQGIAEATAACVALAKLEATKDARELDRTVQLAQLLAERLLGETLRTSETVVAQLAKQALAEVRGASRVRMEVSASDQPILAAHLQELHVTDTAVELSVDPELSSGDFRIETNIGSLDARLGARLEMLSKKLREGLLS